MKISTETRVVVRLGVFLLGLAAGCTPGHHETAPSDVPGATLITEADREFDFGDVIGRRGLKLDHRYRLSNPTDHDVRISNVVNRKTCCGVVRVGRTLLHPGESTEIDLTLIVGDRFDAVVHETEVVSDLAGDESIVLRTTAQAHPPFRVKAVSAAERPVLIASPELKREEFRLAATGTADDHAVDLDTLSLHSSIKAEWLGAKQTLLDSDGIDVKVRGFSVWLDAKGEPGDRAADIVFRDAKNAVVHQHVVRWEVASPLAVSPKMLVIQPETREYRVLLRSRDNQPFRITGIDSKGSGLSGRALGSEKSLIQTVAIKAGPAVDVERGTLIIATDHPAQSALTLEFMKLR